MSTSRRLAFLLEDFSLAAPSTAVGQPTPNPVRSTPAQQILDRLSGGYPRDGEFRRPRHQVATVFVVGGGGAGDLRNRLERGLVVSPTAEAAVRAADDVLIVPRGAGAVPIDDLTRIALAEARPGARIFVYGALASSTAVALEFTRQAAMRGLTLIAGTTLVTPWFLPPHDPPRDSALREALIVVQGTWPSAELYGVEGILPIVGRRPGGESGVHRVRHLEGAAVWQAGKKEEWSRRLLAAALSRSHSPQGDAIKDGRTQDLFGLGLVPKMALQPRAWQWEHTDRLKTTVLVLDGVVADFNCALELGDRSQFSAQIFRAPAPAEHHYTPLVAALEDYFSTGQRPWPQEREWWTVALLEIMRSAVGRSGRWLEVPKSP